ncbi:MAG: hypothetical protein MJE63_13680 [Proteobacteria bacterium]|nr:hypothetical protein [Pseudomonadota bacterium]
MAKEVPIFAEKYLPPTFLGRSITSSNTGFVEHSRKYLASFYQNTISLNTLLEQAGAIFTQERDECDIDLSPEALEKDSIINLLS